LASKIWSHRPIATNVDFRLELALLRKLYRTGRPMWALRLGEWYAARGDRRLAKYVAARLPDDGGDGASFGGRRTRLRR
ncbi:MAG: hypothetical protein ABEN55_03025, partial [Bradymonadaceae bacterium]